MLQSWPELVVNLGIVSYLIGKSHWETHSTLPPPPPHAPPRAMFRDWNIVAISRRQKFPNKCLFWLGIVWRVWDGPTWSVQAWMQLDTQSLLFRIFLEDLRQRKTFPDISLLSLQVPFATNSNILACSLSTKPEHCASFATGIIHIMQSPVFFAIFTAMFWAFSLEYCCFIWRRENKSFIMTQFSK